MTKGLASAVHRARLRLYRATLSAICVLGPGERRIAVNLDSKDRAPDDPPHPQKSWRSRPVEHGSSQLVK